MGSSSKSSPLPCCATPGVCEAGTDEAGRGCLAGPVVAAAVILPDGFSHPDINDSKKLTEKARLRLRDIIVSQAVSWAVAVVSPAEIDRLNILRASIHAMHLALDGLTVRPGEVIVDGNRFTPYRDLRCTTYVKGDGRFANIAAASILAKTIRDAYMERLAQICPGYGWEVNKGYPTAEHRAAIAALGATPYHRRTFKLLPDPTLF